MREIIDVTVKALLSVVNSFHLSVIKQNQSNYCDQSQRHLQFSKSIKIQSNYI